MISDIIAGILIGLLIPFIMSALDTPPEPTIHPVSHGVLTRHIVKVRSGAPAIQPADEPPLVATVESGDHPEEIEIF